MKNFKITIVALFIIFLGTNAYGQTIRPTADDAESVRSYLQKDQMLKATQKAIERRQSSTLEMIERDSVPTKMDKRKTKSSKPTIKARKNKPQ